MCSIQNINTLGGSSETRTGISARVLSSELKNMEQNGFIVRKVYNDILW